MDVACSKYAEAKYEEMKILFHLGHPAHFHLFKRSIRALNNEGHSVSILIKKKDVLEDLLVAENLEFENLLPKGRTSSKLGMLWGLVKTDYRMYVYCRNTRPDILVGTSIAISHVGRFLGIPSINVNEDDAAAVPYYAKLSYPWTSMIISPDSCKNGKWEYKTLHYPGYHELAYLHPSFFRADSGIVRKQIPDEKPYFLIRISALGAHHDKGVEGMSRNMVLKLIEILNPYGKVYISSEDPIHPDLESNRLSIRPEIMHHVLAGAELLISDSQTMSAEAAILGTPYVRYNGFVGRLGYLADFEDKYGLGAGIVPPHTEKLYETVSIFASSGKKNEARLIAERIFSKALKVDQFLNWVILNYKLKKVSPTNPPDFAVFR